ncbi:hypothetical protein HBE96_17315 [Clostridium sp. P21]|uniref:Uncharacterized protein n=1 Tax=Clostridium muellerianum TaxID=2716538 RepID=A0A7Y0HQ50_9CLOT|nr:hypothetical protein [Clostridium muellerianum]NMM64382.1 hypothetical protein [Clostridium muellerianum]
MKKQQKQELKESLKAIEEVLNRHEQYEIDNGDYYDYALLLHKDTILFDISVEDEDLQSYEIEITDVNKSDVKSICKLLINYIYENEINPRQSYVKNANNFRKRKIKSLCLWSERFDETKVEKINKELIEHYQKVKEYENKISKYKNYISDIYSVLWILCKNWKAEDIKDYCIERFKHFNVQDVEVFIEDNRVTAIYIGNSRRYKLSDDIDSFSKNDDVFRELFSKVKTIQELEEAAC